MKYLTRFLDFVMKAIGWFLIGVLGVMTVVLVLSVLSRYFFGFSIHWSDPLARYGQVWIMLLGSTLALRKGMHIGVDNFVNKLPEKIRVWVLRFNLALILVFSITMTKEGFNLISIAEGQIIPEMGIPMKYIYYMIPVAGALLVLTSIELLLNRDVRSITTAEGEEHDD
ncbi:MAG: TRAP transporter small permease [Sphaerochaetaceae bacterium]|nr:TRAP transporter small permease [Sphaerochaetaceae bacterium]